MRVMKFHLFNCDNAYRLDSVETLLLKMADDLNLRILVDKLNFRLSEMSDVYKKKPFLSYKWIMPSLLSMHMNPVSLSTKTMLVLATRRSTELCCKRLVGRL